MDGELTIREFTVPFEMNERVTICDENIANPFYNGKLESLFLKNDEETLNMFVTKAIIRDGKLQIIAHY